MIFFELKTFLSSIFEIIYPTCKVVCGNPSKYTFMIGIISLLDEFDEKRCTRRDISTLNSCFNKTICQMNDFYGFMYALRSSWENKF